jgi:hypothetical protein
MRVETAVLLVSLSHALPDSTRRINICGDMHIKNTYTGRNADDVELPVPNVTKKATPESVYGSIDSTTSVTTEK